MSRPAVPKAHDAAAHEREGTPITRPAAPKAHDAAAPQREGTPMSGALHLIPVGLGDAPPERWLPADVRALAGRLDTYIAENAKTARAFLKLIGTTRPLQEITIHTLTDKINDGQIKAWLDPVRKLSLIHI
mgnify:FL=1